MESEVRVGHRCEARLGLGRGVVSVKAKISTALRCSKHSVSRTVSASSMSVAELGHRLGEAAEAQPLPFCQVFRHWAYENSRSPRWAWSHNNLLMYFSFGLSQGSFLS